MTHAHGRLHKDVSITRVDVWEWFGDSTCIYNVIGEYWTSVCDPDDKGIKVRPGARCTVKGHNHDRPDILIRRTVRRTTRI